MRKDFGHVTALLVRRAAVLTLAALLAVPSSALAAGAGVVRDEPVGVTAEVLDTTEASDAADTPSAEDDETTAAATSDVAAAASETSAPVDAAATAETPGPVAAAPTADVPSTDPNLLTTWDKPVSTGLSEPFPVGALNNHYYRIPSIVALSDGTLVASADARWGTTADSPANIDDLVSVSTDKGATWTAQLVDRFLDTKDGTNDWSGKAWGTTSATKGQIDRNASYIDPSLLVTKHDVIWRVVDVMTANVGNFGTMGTESQGFDETGHLLVSKGEVDKVASKNASDYAYYVNTDAAFTTTVNDKDRTLSPIVDRTTKAEQGVWVDAEFNLYVRAGGASGAEGSSDAAGTYLPLATDQYTNGAGARSQDVDVQQNLFYAQSQWKVYPTNYLGVRSGTVKGDKVEWSDMRLLTTVKHSGEGFLGTGAGLGVAVTKSDGTERLIFPVYHVVGSAFRASTIYSDDGGQTWQRGADITGQQTSESQIVVMPNGKLRLYSRSRTNRIQVAVSSSYGTSWEPAAEDTQLPGATNNNISFINVSGTLTNPDGKTYENLVVGSYAFSSNNGSGAGRWGGIIRVGSMDAQGNVTWLTDAKDKYPLAQQYSYSSLVQIDGETIGHLWETENSATERQSGRIKYDSFTLTGLLKENGKGDWTYTPAAAETYEVTIAPGNDNPESTVSVTRGDKLQEPTAPSWPGHTFSGWYVHDADGNPVAYDFDKPVTAGFTLFGYWTQDSYTVSFDMGGGDTAAAPAIQTLTYGQRLSRPDDPTREGYDFAGWFAEGASVPWGFSKDVVTGDLRLTARWTPKRYTVTFDVVGADGAIQSQTVEYGGTLSEPAAPTREGYSFAGWYADAALTAPYDFSLPVTGSVTLYARWEPVAQTGPGADPAPGGGPTGGVDDATGDGAASGDALGGGPEYPVMPIDGADAPGEGVPATGDATDLALPTAIGAVGAVLVGGAVCLRRRQGC